MCDISLGCGLEKDIDCFLDNGFGGKLQVLTKWQWSVQNFSLPRILLPLRHRNGVEDEQKCRLIEEGQQTEIQTESEAT